MKTMRRRLLPVLAATTIAAFHWLAPAARADDVGSLLTAAAAAYESGDLSGAEQALHSALIEVSREKPLQIERTGLTKEDVSSFSAFEQRPSNRFAKGELIRSHLALSGANYPTIPGHSRIQLNGLRKVLDASGDAIHVETFVISFEHERQIFAGQVLLALETRIGIPGEFKIVWEIEDTGADEKVAAVFDVIVE